MNKFKILWNRFWFMKGPPHALAIFRFLFGIFWMIRWCSWMPHVELYFSGDGLYLPKYPYPVNGIHDFNSLMGWITQPLPVTQAWGIYSIGLVLILFICIGLFTRISLVAFFLCLNYYYYLYIHLHGTSYDRMLILIVIMLIFSPCGLVLSADEKIAGRKNKRPLDLNRVLWTQRMICVQVAIVYFATGIHKLVSPVWKNGDNLATAFRGDYATSLGFWVAKMNIPLAFYDLLVIFIIIFELTIGFLLFSKRWQKWAFLFGAIFHILNSTLLWIPEFLVVILTYVLFVDPEKVKLYIEKKLKIIY